MKFNRLLYCAIILTAQQLNADLLVVHNMTEHDMYAAVYYVLLQSVDRPAANEPVLIPSGSAAFVERPGLKLPSDRYVVLSEKKENLIATFPKASALRQFHEMLSAPAGYLKGSEFFITQDQSKILHIYNNVEWKLQPFQNVVASLPAKFWSSPIFSGIDYILKPIREKYEKNEYSGKKASVRTGIDLGHEEKGFVSQRLTHIKKSLETILKRPVNAHAVPRIGLCMSGGGYRAMIASLGFLLGLQNGGLLDCSLYMAGLSGSTWLIGPWLESKKSLEAYKELLMQRLTHDLFQGTNNQEIIAALVRKLVFNQPLTLVDIYGALLAQKLLRDLGKNPQDIYLYRQVEYIKNGTNPYPIYTAVMPVKKYEWFEFAPYECGSTFLNAFVQTWAFSRFFKEGKSVHDIEPPMSLGFVMGVCGSAFRANLREVLEEYEKGIKPAALHDFLLYAIANPTIGTARIAIASIFNITFGMKNHPLNTYEKITLVDAGSDFNLPFPPLLRPERALDIIIVLDASANVITDNAPALRSAQAYANEHNMLFPPIDYSKVTTQNCSVHQDPNNPQAPIIIYVPLLYNKNYGTLNPQDLKTYSFLDTFNFIYTPAQVNQLSGLLEFTMQEANPLIMQVVNQVIERKEQVKK
ncbi:MAG: hypothetical protein WA432_04675 [Candidatus Babeliaceae bacterium]